MKSEVVPMSIMFKQDYLLAAADGSTVTSYQTVRLAGTDNGIIVDEVKEETV